MQDDLIGRFTIDPDRARGLLRVHMSGFYSVDDVMRYHAAVAAASDLLSQAPSAQVMLCDISDMKIQSQDIVAAFARVMGDPRYAGRRVAFVVSGTLARMQLMRIISGRTVAIFATTREAEAWLFDATAQAA